MARPRPTTPVLSELASVPGDALAEGTPPPIGPHTAAQRHDGVLTLLDDSADTASISTSRRSLEKAEAKRLQKLEKFRKQAEKDARKAAKKQGRPDDWESFMLEVPEELLSPEELTKRRWLKSVPMFDGLDGAFVGALAQALQTRTVAAESIIIEKGSVGDEMYFIKEGRCDVHLDLADDAVATREPGEFIGETALLEDAPRNAYVRATAAMVLYVLSKAQLTEVLARFPEAEPIIRSPADDHRAELVQKYQEEAAFRDKVGGKVVATAEQLAEAKEKAQQKADAEEQLRLGQEAFDAFNFAAALDFFGKAQELRPGHSKTEMLLKSATTKAKQWELMSTTERLVAKKTNPSKKRHAAHTTDRSAQSQQAQERRAAEASRLYNEAESCAQRSDFPAAIQSLEAALEEAQGADDPGLVSKIRQNLDAARATRAESQSQALALYEQGAAARSASKFYAASTSFRKALELATGDMELTA